MHKDSNNFDVNPDAQCVVDTCLVFSNIDLWNKAKDNNEIVKIQGRYWWLTTVDTAIRNGFDCYQYENGVILNSYIRAKYNQKGV